MADWQPMKISAGSSKVGGPLCLYDEAGDPIALMNSKRADKERVALGIVSAFNRHWQPIETSPKDGTNILAYDIDMGPVVATAQDGDWLLVGTPQRVYVSHWMPLPEPPK